MPARSVLWLKESERELLGFGLRRYARARQQLGAGIVVQLDLTLDRHRLAAVSPQIAEEHTRVARSCKELARAVEASQSLKVDFRDVTLIGLALHQDEPEALRGLRPVTEFIDQWQQLHTATGEGVLAIKGNLPAQPIATSRLVTVRQVTGPRGPSSDDGPMPLMMRLDEFERESLGFELRSYALVMQVWGSETSESWTGMDFDDPARDSVIASCLDQAGRFFGIADDARALAVAVEADPNLVLRGPDINLIRRALDECGPEVPCGLEQVARLVERWRTTENDDDLLVHVIPRTPDAASTAATSIGHRQSQVTHGPHETVTPPSLAAGESERRNLACTFPESPGGTRSSVSR